MLILLFEPACFTKFVASERKSRAPELGTGFASFASWRLCESLILHASAPLRLSRLLWLAFQVGVFAAGQLVVGGEDEAAGAIFAELVDLVSVEGREGS